MARHQLRFLVVLYLELQFLNGNKSHIKKVIETILIPAHIQSTLVTSNSKGLTEILRDIRTSTYQSLESEENSTLNNHI